MKSFVFHFGMGCLLLALGAPSVLSAEVMVFAAASLTESLKEIGAAYEKQTGDQVRFNFAASGVLARQIEAGAPADLFFSADEAKMDLLAKQDLVVPETRKPRLGNTLVVVVPLDSTAGITRIEDLATSRVKRLALGNPASVPAGVYARELLEKQKLWPTVAAKVLPSESVRAALAVVESGDAEAAIVYKTDAGISKRVKIAIAVSPEQGPAIRYPVALLKTGRQPDAARKFLDYLWSRAAGDAFQRYGFVLLEPAAKP